MDTAEEKLKKREQYEEFLKKGFEEIKRGAYYRFSKFNFEQKLYCGILPVKMSANMHDNYIKLKNKINSEGSKLSQTITDLYLIYPKSLNAPAYKSLVNELNLDTNYESNKINMVKAVIKEIPKGKTIIFSYYREPLRILYNEL